MNIKDFLIDNYIWIIVVILLLIITVIGFLADKSKSKKSKESENSNTNNQAIPVNNMTAQPINYQNQQPMNYQPNNNINMQQPIPNQGMPANFSGPINTTVTPLNQNVTVPTEQPIPTPLAETTVPSPVTNLNQNFGQPINNNMQFINNQEPLMNASQPIDVINTMNNVNPEPIYQPLSEQTPIIQPREIQTLNQINQPNMNSIPTPLESNSIPPQPINQTPIMSQGMNAPLMNEPIINEPMNPAPQINIPNQNLNFQNNNMTGMPNSMNYSTMEPSSTSQPINPQPINFVYGPQQNNNNQ